MEFDVLHAGWLVQTQNHLPFQMAVVDWSFIFGKPYKVAIESVKSIA